MLRAVLGVTGHASGVRARPRRACARLQEVRVAPATKKGAKPGHHRNRCFGSSYIANPPTACRRLCVDYGSNMCVCVKTTACRRLCVDYGSNMYMYMFLCVGLDLTASDSARNS